MPRIFDDLRDAVRADNGLGSGISGSRNSGVTGRLRAHVTGRRRTDYGLRTTVDGPRQLCGSVAASQRGPRRSIRQVPWTGACAARGQRCHQVRVQTSPGSRHDHGVVDGPQQGKVVGCIAEAQQPRTWRTAWPRTTIHGRALVGVADQVEEASAPRDPSRPPAAPRRRAFAARPRQPRRRTARRTAAAAPARRRRATGRCGARPRRRSCAKSPRASIPAAAATRPSSGRSHSAVAPSTSRALPSPRCDAPGGRRASRPETRSRRRSRR